MTSASSVIGRYLRLLKNLPEDSVQFFKIDNMIDSIIPERCRCCLYLELAFSSSIMSTIMSPEAPSILGRQQTISKTPTIELENMV